MIRKIEKPLVLGLIASIGVYMAGTDKMLPIFFAVVFILAGFFSLTLWSLLKVLLVKIGNLLGSLIGVAVPVTFYAVVFGAARPFKGRNFRKRNNLENKHYTVSDLEEPF
jgi:hypothetical protein